MTFADFDALLLSHAILDPDIGLSLICHLHELMQRLNVFT